MTLILDLTDKLARFPIAYGYQPVRGWPVKHFDTAVGSNSQRTRQHALGEGPWDACEKLWADAFPILESDFTFHPGVGNDVPDANFPSDAPHPWTAYISAKTGVGLSEDQSDKLFGIYRTLRTGNYNGAGQQLNAAGTVVTPSDPRDEFFFKPNPANVAVDQLLRWGKNLNSIVNWPAWVNWRDYNDELIPWDDAVYTPRSLSLTPTTGGSLSGTYYIRVSTMKSGDESSASLKTLETKADKITLTGGQNAFQVNWLIKGDETIPPTNPSGITGYRVYIGTTLNVWLGYFTVSSASARTFLVTTTSGVTSGSPLNLATSGLLQNIKRFECGLFFIPPYDLSMALDKICQISCADWQWSGYGTSTYRNDKIRFMSPADRSPVFTLNLAETGVGSFKTYPIDRRNRPNQIIVNFRDKGDDYIQEGQPVILNRDQLQEDDKLVKPFTIDGGTMYRSQAQRIASFFARVLCDSDQMASMEASPKSYHVLPGDVINVTNDLPDWTDVQFVIRKKLERTENKIGDEITAQLYSPGLYSDSDYSPLPLNLPSPRSNPFDPPPVATNLVLTEVGGFGPNLDWISAIRGTFDFATFPGKQTARIWLKEIVLGDSTFRLVQTVFPDSTNHGTFEIRGVLRGNYEVKVVTENSLGISLTSGHPVTAISIAVPLSTVFKIFDNVPPKDSIEGLGVTVGVVRATGSGTWHGVAGFRDRGYGYDFWFREITLESTLGHTTNNGDVWLAATAGKVYFIPEGGATPDLTNATPTEITNGKNNYFVGREKIGVQTWTNLGGGIWKGENLVRGLNHTDIFQNTHTAQEDMIQLDDAAFFIPIEFLDVGSARDLKFVTFGQQLSEVTASSFTARGDSVRPYALSSRSAIRDGSGDWNISAVNNSRPSEIPADFVFRMRRVSDGALLRDLPIPSRNYSIAGMFKDTTIGSHDVTITNNNVVSVTPFSQSAVIGLQKISETGFVVTGKITLPKDATLYSGALPFASIAFLTDSEADNHSGYAYGQVIWQSTALDTLNINGVELVSHTLSGINVPTTDGIMFFLLALVGTEFRFYVAASGVPVPGLTPAALRGSFAFADFPVRLRVMVNGGAKVENIWMNGLNNPHTIYAKRQQAADLILLGVDAGTAAAGLSTIDTELWQTSRYSALGFKGFSIREVF